MSVHAHNAQIRPSSRTGSPLLRAPADGTYGVNHPLSPWTGFALMCGYAVVLVGLASWRLRRSDA